MARIAANLDDAAIRLSDLREDGKAELLEILASVSYECSMYPCIKQVYTWQLRGSKCLVLDTQLQILLSHIITDGRKELNVRAVQRNTWFEADRATLSVHSAPRCLSDAL
jgi:hypothetical protein